MLLKILQTTLIIFISSSLTFGQRISYGKPKADKENKVIYIPYKIKESSKIQNLYNIKLYYSKGKNDSLIGPLKQVIGDVGENITPGDKAIVWNYWAEEYGNPNYTFDGQNVRFIIKVTYRPNPNDLMGPEAALFSMALPGWGNTKTKPKYQRKFWYLTTAATVGFVGAGLYYRSQSNQTYNQYLQSRTIDEAQNLFTKANNQQQTSGTLIVIGGAIWLTDITRVFIRGLKNKKERKMLNSQPSKPSPELGLMYDYVQDKPTLGVNIKF